MPICYPNIPKSHSQRVANVSSQALQVEGQTSTDLGLAEFSPCHALSMFWILAIFYSCSVHFYLFGGKDTMDFKYPPVNRKL